MKAGSEDRALQEASGWVARMQNPERSGADEAALAVWLRSRPENAIAFDHVTHVWELAGGASGWRAAARPSRRRLMVGLGAAAVAGTGVIGWSVAATAQTIRTSVGEQRRMTTPDGTRVVLDTDSVLVVDKRAGRDRRAVLKRGRAAFNVAEDGDRMFVISMGDWRLAALAGDFDVCAPDLGAAVLVRQGSLIAERGGVRTRVDQGCRLDLAADKGLVAPRAVDVDVASAWRGGQIVLENTPLADAAAALKRYARKPIVAGPALADFRVSGAYRTGAPLDFAESVAVLADADVKVFRNRIEVLAK